MTTSKQLNISQHEQDKESTTCLPPVVSTLGTYFCQTTVPLLSCIYDITLLFNFTETVLRIFFSFLSILNGILPI